MKFVWGMAWIMWLLSSFARAEGIFVFNNRIPPEVNARFVLCTDPPGTSSVGTGFQVQLFGGPEGTPRDQLVYLQSTTFRGDAGSQAAGYATSVTSQVPGVGNERATILVRVFDGPSWEAAQFRFEKFYTVQLTIGLPPPDFVRLGTSPLVLSGPPESCPVYIPDPALNAAIRDRLGKPDGALTPEDLVSLRHLQVSGSDLSNLEGLGAAANLESLIIARTRATELSVPSGLTHLEWLQITDTALEKLELTPDLGSLRLLFLRNNALAQLTLPSGLTNLYRLDLSGNPLTNLTAAGSSKLQSLELCCGVPFGDLSYLGEIPSLSGLKLNGNKISDLAFPPGLSNLSYLDLSGNQLRSLSIPKRLTNLTTVLLGYNLLTNLSLPAQVESLQLCCGNRLSDFSFLEGLTNLRFLGLGYNQLTNLLLPMLPEFVTLNLGGNPLETVWLPKPLVGSSGAPLITIRGQGNATITGYPITPSSLSATRPQASIFEVRLTAPPGVYAISASTNLMDWEVVGTLTNTAGTSSFVEPIEAEIGGRFYRAKTPP